MPSKIPTGTTLELGSKLRALSRRSVLRGLATAATASGAALSAAVERAYGKKPEGKVIVHTDDIHGQPDTVRVIPKERHRRLKLYERLPIQKFTDRDEVQALTITQRSDDPTDLALKFLVEKNDRATRRRVPNNYKRVPTVVEEKPLKTKTEAIEGGYSVVDPTETAGNGTICMIGYDANSSEKLILTAAHVTEGADTVEYAGDELGRFHKDDEFTDTVSYTLTGDFNVDPLGTVSQLPNISGAWNFAGLADKVGQTDDGDSVSDGGTVGVEFYGRTSGYVTDTCNNTKRTGDVLYQADMKNNRTDDGDSGGPWVDDNGKLLGLHHGTSGYSGDFWSVATVGRPALDAVDVSLS